MIKIFALGGLNETGKNMYVVEVDKDIFVFDAGMKFNFDMAYGVDYILPDYTYLEENINRVKGIFISHAHKSHMGAVVDILRDIKNIRIFGSRLTIEIIKDELENNNLDYKKYNLNVLNPHKKLNFGNNAIFPVSITHSIPGAFMYVLYTKEGNIVYSGDYVFDMAMKGEYQTDLGKLAYVGKQGVLCLLGESIYSRHNGYTAPKNHSVEYIKKLFKKADRRIISTINPDHVFRIQEIMDATLYSRRKLVIMGSNLQKRIKKLISLGYLDFDETFIGTLNNVNDNNAVILIADLQEMPFGNLNRILQGFDKFIKLEKTDTVFISEPDIDGLERKKAIVMDKIAEQNAKAYSLDDNHLLFHASKEDIRMLINLINPKYYFPIRGEYRDQVYNADIASEEGIPDKNILLKENGDLVIIANKKLSKEKQKIKTDEILIDGKVYDDVGELVLKDRESLGDNGIVIISATIDNNTKKLLHKTELVTRGFIDIRSNKELIDKARDKAENIVLDNLDPKQKYTDYNKIKNEIRADLGKLFYRETDMRPLIITVIQEI